MNLKDAAIRNRDPPLVYVQLDSALEAAEKELERAEKEKRKLNSETSLSNRRLATCTVLFV